MPFFNYSPPKSGNDFELLCCDLLRLEYRDFNANLRRYGRSGQDQSGVDIKGTIFATLFAAQASTHFTPAKVTSDIARAKTIAGLKSLHLITSASRSTAPQNVIDTINQERAADNSFTIKDWYWDDILEKLNDKDYRRICYKYGYLPSAERMPFLKMEEYFDRGTNTPNNDLFEKDLHFKNTLTEDRVMELLAQQRKCLLIGAPDRGKTTTALSVARNNFAGNTFYYSVDQLKQPDVKDFLEQISLYNYPDQLFIIDNCHNNTAFANELFDYLSKYEQANFLLVARDIGKNNFQHDQVNFVADMEEDAVAIKSEQSVIEGIIKKYCSKRNIETRLIGDIALVAEKCGDDLSILNQFLKAWDETSMLSETSMSKVFAYVRETYLQQHEDDYLAIAALYQFEILALDLAGFIASKDLYKQGLLQYGQSEDGALMQYGYAHSNIARLVIQSKENNFRGRYANDDAYTLAQLENYIACLLHANPPFYLRIFDLLFKLRINGRNDLLDTLLQKDVFAAFFSKLTITVGHAGPAALYQYIYHIRGTLISLWRAEDKAVNGRAYELLKDFLDNGIGRQRLPQLLQQVPLRVLSQFVALAQIDPPLREVIRNLDFQKLAGNIGTDTASAIDSFVKYIEALGIEKDRLLIFFKHLDFKMLGQCSRNLRTNSITGFLRTAAQMHSTPYNMKAFCEELDFKHLGNSANATSFSSIRQLLGNVIQLKVDHAIALPYFSKLDMRQLGVRAREGSLKTAMAFLDFTLQLKASDAQRQAFCEGIGGTSLGQKIKAAKEKADLENKTPPNLRFFFVLLSKLQSKSFVDDFCTGLTYPALNELMADKFGPDILSACIKFLFSGYANRYEREKELRQKGINIEELRFNAFINRPATNRKGNKNEEEFLKNLLLSLSRTRGFFNKIKKPKPLRQWNALVYNTYRADKDFFEQHVTGIFQSFTQAGYEELFTQASVRDIHTFMRYFSPVDNKTKFTWTFPHKIDFMRVLPLPKLLSSPLRDIAFILQTLHYINHGACSAAYAAALDQQKEIMLQKMRGELLKPISFYAWKLSLNAVGESPAIFRDPTFAEMICHKFTEELKPLRNHELIHDIYRSYFFVMGALKAAGISGQGALADCMPEATAVSVYELSVQQKVEAAIVFGMLNIAPEQVTPAQLEEALSSDELSKRSPNLQQIIQHVR